MHLDSNFSMVPVVFENTRVQQDRTGGFIDLTDIGMSNRIMGLGEDVSSVEGSIVIRIYTPLGSGTQLGRQIATALDTLLKGKNLSGLELGVPVFESFGQVPEADLFQQNLTFPYQYFYGQIESDC